MDNDLPKICYCLEPQCYCEPSDMLIIRGRWQCPRCEEHMPVKFRRSHTVICRWRSRLQRAGLWNRPSDPARWNRLSTDAATWTADDSEDTP